MISGLIDQLKLPDASQIEDLDDPNNVFFFRRLIKRKPFLKKTYISFYQTFIQKIGTLSAQGKIVELGSGPGFFKQLYPAAVTSDIIPYEGVDLVFSGLDMPFSDAEVGAFVMIDVLHHVKDSRQFFNEMNRCLIDGGKIIMIEPANTYFSRLIYQNFHHEPFDVNGFWGLTDGGPLSGANMAIPSIIFQRDYSQFVAEYPHLKVRTVKAHTPFRYLLSGGLSFRQLLPSWTYPFVNGIEWLLSPLNNALGMFMTIELEKVT